MLIAAMGFWERFREQASGPGFFRFYLQPLAAVALGIRDGWHDADEGKPPYFFGVLFDPTHRREQLAAAAKQIALPFFIAVILALIYQWIIFGRPSLLGALFIGVLLIAIPYILARGITNRIVTAFRRKRVAI